MDKSNFIIGIQARSTSTRLPGKVFFPILGIRAWRLVAESCFFTGIETRLLVPENDLPLIDDIKRTHLKDSIITGPEDSPLKRFKKLAASCECGNIIRITADCPLMTPWMILDMAYRFDDNVFVYNELDGMDVQIAHRSIFEKEIYLDNEHVFNMEKIKEHGLYTKWEMHLSVDTKEQYDHIKFLVEE